MSDSQVKASAAAQTTFRSAHITWMAVSVVLTAVVVAVGLYFIRYFRKRRTPIWGDKSPTVPPDPNDPGAGAEATVRAGGGASVISKSVSKPGAAGGDKGSVMAGSKMQTSKMASTTKKTQMSKSVGLKAAP